METQETQPVEGEAIKDESLVPVKGLPSAAVVFGQGALFKSVAEVWALAQGIKSGGAGQKGASVGQIATAILKGQELGLGVATSVGNITVVNGRSSIMGDLALALVRRSGKLKSYKREWIGTDGQEDYGCRITMARKDTGEEIDYAFTIGEAISAGLVSRSAGKSVEGGARVPVWSGFRKRMVYYRALGFVLRDLFGDILFGTYLKEELEVEAGSEATAPFGVDTVTVSGEADPMFADEKPEPVPVVEAEVIPKAEVIPETEAQDAGVPEKPPTNPTAPRAVIGSSPPAEFAPEFALAPPKAIAPVAGGSGLDAAVEAAFEKVIDAASDPFALFRTESEPVPVERIEVTPRRKPKGSTKGSTKNW